MRPLVLLRCGCQVLFDEKVTPVCPTHGAQAIARVLSMPAPRFRGVASGPHCESVELSAVRQRFKES